MNFLNMTELYNTFFVINPSAKAIIFKTLLEKKKKKKKILLNASWPQRGKGK